MHVKGLTQMLGKQRVVYKVGIIIRCSFLIYFQFLSGELDFFAYNSTFGLLEVKKILKNRLEFIFQ